MTKQVWYADDATAGGSLNHLKAWWDRISAIGPDYGYYPNASKTWLVVKEANLEEATALFQGTGISITFEGKRHLEQQSVLILLLRTTSSARSPNGFVK